MTPTLANLFGPIGATELIILGILGLLIFGKRLPEVGKNLGKGIVEFKKGLAGVDDDLKNTRNAMVEPPRQLSAPTTPTATASRSAEELQAENERLRALLAEKNRQA